MSSLSNFKVLDVTPNSILVREDTPNGMTTQLVPVNTFNTLKYVIKGSFEGMVGQSHTKVYLGDDCVISPTTQQYVFCLEYDGNLVHTTPDTDKRVCNAVLKAYTEKDFSLFKELFNELYQKRLRNEFIELFIFALGDRVKSAIIQGMPGYIVDNNYFVGQNANSYWIGENTTLHFLCIVPRNHEIKPMKLEYKGTNIRLGQQEQIFMSKIIMLLNKEKYKDDPVFWRQIDQNRR